MNGVEATAVPLVAVKLIGKAPPGVVEFVAKVTLELPCDANVGGLKLAAVPLGRPDAPRVNVPLNPPSALTVTVVFALGAEGLTDADDGDATITNPPCVIANDPLVD